MHIARLLEKQGYITTTWAGGIVSYLPGEPRSAESTPSLLANGKYLYPAFDATGTVRMWADASGNIIARNAPGPYGEDLGYFPGPRTSMLGYAGYLGDKGGSGLWHTPNRSLTNQGRFLSVDPSGTLNLHDPRTFNQYAYVAGNPISFVDPIGLSVYVVTYAMDTSKDMEFSLAAETWAGDVESASGFNRSRDTVLLRQLSELGDLKSTFSEARDLEPSFGKVAAWAHFSHGGPNEGPYFGVRDTKDSNQASMDTLKGIGFNFEKQAVAAYYSCQSKKFSEQFSYTFGIQAFGFSATIYPSASRSFRQSMQYGWFSDVPTRPLKGPVYFLQAEGWENGTPAWKAFLIQLGWPGAVLEPIQASGPLK